MFLFHLTFACAPKAQLYTNIKTKTRFLFTSGAKQIHQQHPNHPCFLQSLGIALNNMPTHLLLWLEVFFQNGKQLWVYTDCEA